jgi:hypothetical protein
MTSATLLSWVLAAAPVPPSDTDAPIAYSEPTVEAGEYTTASGRRTRWASATYLLPDGRFAEVFITADDTASGEASIFVDGEAIASSSFEERRGVTRWTSSEPGTHEAATAAMAVISDRGAGELLDAFIPGATAGHPCDETDHKFLKAAKYVWGAVVIASDVACCHLTAGLGCYLCHAGALIAHEEGAEALDGKCA